MSNGLFRLLWTPILLGMHILSASCGVSEGTDGTDTVGVDGRMLPDDDAAVPADAIVDRRDGPPDGQRDVTAPDGATRRDQDTRLDEPPDRAGETDGDPHDARSDADGAPPACRPPPDEPTAAPPPADAVATDLCPLAGAFESPYRMDRIVVDGTAWTASLHVQGSCDRNALRFSGTVRQTSEMAGQDRLTASFDVGEAGQPPRARIRIEVVPRSDCAALDMTQRVEGAPGCTVDFPDRVLSPTRPPVALVAPETLTVSEEMRLDAFVLANEPDGAIAGVAVAVEPLPAWARFVRLDGAAWQLTLRPPRGSAGRYPLRIVAAGPSAGRGVSRDLDLLVLAASGPASPPCTESADCGPCARCRHGVCTVPWPCDDTHPCGAGETCCDGVCLPPLVCVAERCAAARACTAERDCPPGASVCEGGAVVRCGAAGQTPVPERDCTAEDGVCRDGACVDPCLGGGSQGCDFLLVDLDNALVPRPDRYLDAAGATFAAVVVAPPDGPPVAVDVVRTEDGQQRSLLFDLNDEVLPATVPPGGFRVVPLPRRDAVGTIRAPLAYRLRTSSPVSTLQFNPHDEVDAFSTDASLLLPVAALGTVHRVVSRAQTFDRLPGFVAVAAAGPDPTTVTLTVTAPTVAGTDESLAEPLAALLAGESLVRTLAPLEVLNVATAGPGADLTGTRVVADGPVAVWGGSVAAHVPNTETCGANGLCVGDGTTPCETAQDCLDFVTCCADHLESPMPPEPRLGRSYVVAQSHGRGAAPDYVRVLATVDGTEVTDLESPGASVVLDAGQWVEWPLTGCRPLQATEPVVVAQFLAGQQAPSPGRQPDDARTGDPALWVVGAPETWRTTYDLFASPMFEENYATVVAPADATVTVDGRPPADATSQPCASGTFVAYDLPLAAGAHRIACEAACHVHVVGFGTFVSYGYAGGVR